MSGLSPPNSKNQEEQTPSIPSNSLLRNSELSKPPPSSSFSAGRVYIPALKLYGTLRYLGEIHIRPGVWAGIELDKEGAGRNDGSLDQHVYFQCALNTGIFIPSSGFEFVNSVDKSSKGNLEEAISNSTVEKPRKSMIPRPASISYVPNTSNIKKNSSDRADDSLKLDFISAIPKAPSIPSTPPNTPLIKKNSFKSTKKVIKGTHVEIVENAEDITDQGKNSSPNSLSPLSPPIPQAKLESKLKRLTLTVSPADLRDYISQSFSQSDEHNIKQNGSLIVSPSIHESSQLNLLPSPAETLRPQSNASKKQDSISNFEKEGSIIFSGTLPVNRENENSALLKGFVDSSDPMNEFKMNNLKLELEVVQSELNLKRKQYKDLQERYESLQNDYAVVSNESKEVKFYLSVAEQAHSGCKSAQLELEKKNNELEKALESKIIENAQLKAKIAASKEGRIQAMSEYADSIEILMKDLRHLQSKYDDLVKQVKSSETNLILSQSASILPLILQEDSDTQTGEEKK